MTVPIYNVPLCSSGECTVKLDLIEMNDNKLIIETEITFKKVPKCELVIL